MKWNEMDAIEFYSFNTYAMQLCRRESNFQVFFDVHPHHIRFSMYCIELHGFWKIEITESNNDGWNEYIYFDSAIYIYVQSKAISKIVESFDLIAETALYC